MKAEFHLGVTSLGMLSFDSDDSQAIFSEPGKTS
jgi:hypothetical protein